MIDEDDLHTDTFSSARGWTAVRVTHAPTGTVAERVRSASLKSAVEAQRECIAEVKRRVTDGSPPTPEPEGEDIQLPADDRRITRAEFDALAARVSRLEEQLDEH